MTHRILLAVMCVLLLAVGVLLGVVIIKMMPLMEFFWEIMRS